MKKSMKKILIFVLAVVMVIVFSVPTFAATKDTNYIEDHSVVDCPQYYNNNGNYYFLIKYPKNRIEDVTVILTRDSNGTSSPCLVSFKYTSFTALYAKEYAYSDDKYDYTWLTIKCSEYPDSYASSFGGMGIRIFYYGDEDIKMATNTANGSTVQGRGYWLNK